MSLQQQQQQQQQQQELKGVKWIRKAAWTSVVYKQEQSNSNTMPHCLGTQELLRIRAVALKHAWQFLISRCSLHRKVQAACQKC